MDFKLFILIFVAFTTQLPTSDSAKILALFTSHLKSHLIIHMAVARALIERGHNLTIVTTIDLDESNLQYKHVKAPGVDFHHLLAGMVQSSYYEKFRNFFPIMLKMMDNSKVAMQSSEMKKLMDTESFDLVLLGYFLNEFEIGIASHFKCPIVVSWMVQPIHAINSIVGNPDEVTHVPNIMWGAKTSADFFGRLKNVILNGVDRVMWSSLRRTYNTYYTEMFPPDKYPTYEESLKNIALILVNHHFSQGPIRANVPAVVEIGGIAIEENPKPLPQDIKQHLDSAKENGAIFFSLGSNVKSSDIGENTIRSIFKVLSSLKQKVVWKWESDKVPGKSENILYKKWFPQNSVLAHPNLKLFITHGGKGSVVESQYFGVPMIGLPIFGDQQANVDSFVSDGYGIGLDYQSFTEQQLKDTINEILTNSKYSENTKRYKDLYRDRPMTPKETAVFWVEYVIRNKGAKHMQSPAVHMPTYQLLGLDVFLFIAVVLYLIYKITKCFCKFLWRKCFCSSKTSSSKKSKEE